MDPMPTLQNSSLPTVTPSSAETVAQKKDKKKKFTILMIFILGVLILVMGIVFIVSFLSRSPKGNTNEQTTPPEQVDTTNWKTYTNSKYNYSFKYPENLTAEEEKSADGSVNQDYVLVRDKTKDDSQNIAFQVLNISGIEFAKPQYDFTGMSTDEIIANKARIYCDADDMGQSISCPSVNQYEVKTSANSVKYIKIWLNEVTKNIPTGEETKSVRLFYGFEVNGSSFYILSTDESVKLDEAVISEIANSLGIATPVQVSNKEDVSFEVQSPGFGGQGTYTYTYTATVEKGTNIIKTMSGTGGGINGPEFKGEGYTLKIFFPTEGWSTKLEGAVEIGESVKLGSLARAELEPHKSGYSNDYKLTGDCGQTINNLTGNSEILAAPCGSFIVDFGNSVGVSLTCTVDGNDYTKCDNIVKSLSITKK